MEMRPPCADIITKSTPLFERSPRAEALTTLLFWQHTAFAAHALPLATPMAEMGEHPRPICAVTS